MSGRKLTAYLVLAAGIALWTALGLVSMHVPFGRDQGVAAYVAEVMARGGVIYKDVYHFNLPGIFFVYRASMFTGLGWPESVNVTQVLFTALTCLCLYFAGTRFASPLTAAFGSVLYGAFATVIYTNYWDIAQKESLACLPLGLALLFFLALAGPGEGGDRASFRRLCFQAVMAGLFSGLAAQFKPTLGIVLACSLYAAWLFRGRKLRALAVVALSAAGFVLAFIPTAVYLVGHDALDPMLNTMVRFGGSYAGRRYQDLVLVLTSPFKSIIRWAYQWSFLVVLAAIAAARLWRLDRGVRMAFLFGALLLFQVILQMKFFSYHWIPLLVPGSLLAARGAGLLLQDIGRAESAVPLSRRRQYALSAVLFALLLGNLWPDARRYRRELLYDRGRIDDVNFLAPYGPWGRGDICPLAMKEAANYIDKHTTPPDPILVVGHEMGLYVLAGRFAPTRFAYDQPLVSEAKYLMGKLSRQALRHEFIKEIDARPPLYILVIRNDQTSIEPEDSYTQMQAFPELKQRIDREYALQTIIEDYMIYRRLPQGADKGAG